jgi:type IV secretion system protein TrbF
MSAFAAEARNYAPRAVGVAIGERLGVEGPVVETPYTRARLESDGLLGLARRQKTLWQLASAVLATLLALALGGLIYLGSLPRLAPYIIEVDGAGEASYRGTVERAYEPTEAVIRHHLVQFIDLTRTVSSDLGLYRKRMMAARNLLTIQGRKFWDEWGTQFKPMVLATTQTTAVEIVSAVPLSKMTWQIDWRERSWDLRANPLGKPVMWRALLKVVRNPPGSEKQLLDNPFGLYVDEFHWDRLMPVE